MAGVELKPNSFRNSGKRPLIQELLSLTPKSKSGYLGPIKSNTNRTMTEFSIDLEIKQPNGKLEMMRVPSLVPGLSQNDVNLLAKDEQFINKTPEERNNFRKKNEKQFKKIFKKAAAHAAKRLKQGKSVYYQDEESTHKVKRNKSLMQDAQIGE
jgi:hypothetical protein|tara:strand:- start:59 stop:520 length:462 start_codon:yes stop_codon:yes gene_type:complete